MGAKMRAETAPQEASKAARAADRAEADAFVRRAMASPRSLSTIGQCIVSVSSAAPLISA
jgi:hypothetical protein